MTPAELAKHARDLGFTRYDAIERFARDAGAFEPVRSRGSTGAGRSFLGGLPCGIDEAVWPRKAGARLSFIAQIELADLPPTVLAQGFPNEGALLFFYDAEQRTWGFDPSDAGSAIVLFVNGNRRSPSTCSWPSDLPDHARYQPV